MTFDEWYLTLDERLPHGHREQMRMAYEASRRDVQSWRPINEHPTEHGWYGIVDAQNQKRAGLWLGSFWAHSAVEPLKAWCPFPPFEVSSEEKKDG